VSVKKRVLPSKVGSIEQVMTFIMTGKKRLISSYGQVDTVLLMLFVARYIIKLEQISMLLLLDFIWPFFKLQTVQKAAE